MTTETSLNSAIARSVSHNEIVKCRVASLTSGLRALSELSDVDDHVEFDYQDSGRRMCDVWGKTPKGEEYRLYLFIEGP